MPSSSVSASAAAASTAAPATTAAGKTARKAVKAAPTTSAPRPAKPALAAAKSAANTAAKAPVPPAKAAKAKLVRDSFTMPHADFALIADLKQRALKFRRPAKKSELLRAGLHALQALDNAALRSALDALVALKPGRPKAAG